MKHKLTKKSLLADLRIICENLDRRFEISLDDKCDNYEYLLNELKSQNNSIHSLNVGAKKDVNKNLDFYILCFDLYLNLVSNLFFTFQHAVNEKKDILNWDFDNEELKHRNPTAIVTLIKATQVNYLLGIKIC